MNTPPRRTHYPTTQARHIYDTFQRDIKAAGLPLNTGWSDFLMNIRSQGAMSVLAVLAIDHPDVLAHTGYDAVLMEDLMTRLQIADFCIHHHLPVEG